MVEPKNPKALTKDSVKRLACPQTGYTLYRDSKTPGLALRVTAAGSRAYVFERRLNGKTLRVTIGSAETWGLDDARKTAGELGVKIDKGINPRDEAAAERARAEAVRSESERQAHVVAAVWRVYIDDRKAAFDAKKRRPAWGKRHADMHTKFAAPGGEPRPGSRKGKTTPGPLAPLMLLKLSELTADSIATWLKREAQARPTNAAQAYRLLRAFLQWAHDYRKDGAHPYRGIAAADACSASEVRKAVPGSKSKDDVLELGQLPAWFEAVRRLPNRTIAAYLQTLLLVGARRNEWAELKWRDVDTKWNSIKLRDKVEGERIIPLTPFVAQLIDSLPRFNKYVFASKTADGGHVVEARIAHNSALKMAGIQHLTLHGLRRSFATLSDYLDEMPAGVVAQIMGHKPSATAERHYKPRPVDLLGKWHTKLEAWILEQARITWAPLPAAARLGVVAADGSVRAAV